MGKSVRKQAISEKHERLVSVVKTKTNKMVAILFGYFPQNIAIMQTA